MKYKQYDIIPQRGASDFRVDIYDSSNRRVGSVGRVAEAIDLIDELCRQVSFILEG